MLVSSASLFVPRGTCRVYKRLSLNEVHDSTIYKIVQSNSELLTDTEGVRSGTHCRRGKRVISVKVVKSFDSRWFVCFKCQRCQRKSAGQNSAFRKDLHVESWNSLSLLSPIFHLTWDNSSTFHSSSPPLNSCFLLFFHPVWLPSIPLHLPVSLYSLSLPLYLSLSRCPNLFLSLTSPSALPLMLLKIGF